MKSRILAAKISLAITLALAAPSANAQISVIDVANVRQTTVSALQNVATVAKQIQQYQTQLQQYQNMIQNTVGAPVQLWQQATQTIDSLQRQVNQISSFARQAGDVNTYESIQKSVLLSDQCLHVRELHGGAGQRLCPPRAPARQARWPQMPTL
jgi:P-type conjugative transfer protein TrbJ